MDMNINNLKEITGDIRKVLVYMVNKENPMDYVFYGWLVTELQKDRHYVTDLVDYMYSAGLFKGKNTSCPSLTPTGLQLGQDIADNDIWDEAVKICDEQKVYSLRNVVLTVNKIIQQRICKAIESK